MAERIYGDSYVEEQTEEATLVQPLTRRELEAPPPLSERRPATTMRPPPPPEPLPRVVPSSMPPPPVAMATLPPPPPPLPPVVSIWRPMLATAALSATIGAFVSVGLWALRGPQQPSRPMLTASTLAPTRPAATSTVAPCPIPSGQESTTTASDDSHGSSASVTSTRSHGPATVASQVSVDALPVEITPPHSYSKPVLRAPASRATRVAAPERSRHSRPAAEEQHAEEHASAADDTPPALPPEKPPTAGPDRAAIVRAVGRASVAATSCEASPQHGRVQITFSPSGNVQSVQLLQPFGNNTVNGCVLRALGRAHVPPFVGEAVAVRKTLHW